MSTKNPAIKRDTSKRILLLTEPLVNMIERTLKPIFFFTSWVLLFYSVGFGSPETISDWIGLETKFTVIQYKSLKTLEQYHKSIHYGHGWWSTTPSFVQLTADKNRKIAAMKTDAIL